MDLDVFRPSRQLRKDVLRWSSALLAVVSAVLALVNIASNQSYSMATLEVVFCIFSLWMFYRTYNARYSLLWCNIYSYFLIGIVSTGTFLRPLESGFFIWSCLFPVLFYLLLGKRYGMLASGIAFTVLLSNIIFKVCRFDFSNIELLINLLLCYLCIWITSHVLEIKRKTSEAALGQLASRDALTGVYNRHALSHNFDRYRRESKQVPLSLLILDLDFFKAVNDQYGHDVGDKVLIQTASLIDAQSDEHLVYRIGGEEFCIALHNTDSHEAHFKAEKIRFAIQQFQFNDATTPIQLTASIGIYQCDKFANLDEVLALADKELYKAKQNGRNQVMVYNKKEQAKVTCS
ncbi:GGDEF domain-containing protein [Vibrio sp. TRT 21S02]|uniref:GGDEF domain-containing protein n=1 Tax=Vibrio sp. TRT 21S02 TaxID=3418507 RepID=UPI003CE6CFE4